VDLGSVLERLLEFPVVVVLVAMWLVGGALLGGFVLAPYFLWVVLA
jgi:hypothetical protein